MTSFGSQFRGIQFTMAFVVSQLGVCLATLHLQPESRGREREVGGGGRTGGHFAISLSCSLGPQPMGWVFSPLGKTFLGTDPEVSFHGDYKSVKLTVKRTFYSRL